VSQIVIVQFAQDIHLDEMIDLWGDRGVVRRLSRDVVEMTSTSSEDVLVVEVKRDERVLHIQGSVSEDAWSWIEQLRNDFHGVVSGEHTDAASSESPSLRSIAPHWRIVGVIIAIALLPLTLVVVLVYAGVQIGKFAIKARKL
jgi:hypothetical protein